MKISDAHCRSHALPCYPFDDEQKKQFIMELESRVGLEVCDEDYRLPPFFGNIPLPKVKADKTH
jgi:hypothetical protein